MSSGAVYKHHGPDRPGEPLPEDGYVMPRRLYGISKLASELITERYGDLFGLSTASVRLVVGVRHHGSRHRQPQLPPRAEPDRAYGRRGAKRVRVNTLDAVGDYIHVEDVARAIVALLRAPRLRYSAYNIASGHDRDAWATWSSWAAEKVPGFHAEIVAAPSRRTSCRTRR